MAIISICDEVAEHQLVMMDPCGTTFISLKVDFSEGNFDYSGKIEPGYGPTSESLLMKHRDYPCGNRPSSWKLDVLRKNGCMVNIPGVVQPVDWLWTSIVGDLPMVAKNYGLSRSAIAKGQGLGKRSA